MDNRLDFYNYLKEHKETLTDKDCLVVLSYNTEQKDCIVQTYGRLNNINAILGVEELKRAPSNSRPALLELSVFILEAAVKMCKEDRGTAEIMQDELNEILKSNEKE